MICFKWSVCVYVCVCVCACVSGSLTLWILLSVSVPMMTAVLCHLLRIILCPSWKSLAPANSTGPSRGRSKEQPAKCLHEETTVLSRRHVRYRYCTRDVLDRHTTPCWSPLPHRWPSSGPDEIRESATTCIGRREWQNRVYVKFVRFR